MPKNRKQKSDQLSEIEKDLQHKGVVFFSYGGLKVSDVEALRKDLRVEKGTLTVSKRNLLLLALKNKGYEGLEEHLNGPVALAVADDEIAPAKVVAQFKKKHDMVQLFGGLLENKFMDAAAVTQLASLPSKQELLGKVVGSMQAPVSGFVNVLAGNLRGLVTVLDAIRSKKA